MYFESVSAALAMDGHGPYVWAAYGLTLAVVAVLVLSPLRRRRRLLRELQGEYRRRQQSQSQSQEQKALEPKSRPSVELS